SQPAVPPRRDRSDERVVDFQWRRSRGIEIGKWIFYKRRRLAGGQATFAIQHQFRIWIVGTDHFARGREIAIGINHDERFWLTEGLFGLPQPLGSRGIVEGESR